MEKILSVIIPAYNVEAYLAKTLDSLLAEEAILDLLELIVINDGSTDATSALAKAYQERFPQTVMVVDKPNGGHGSAINAGIRKASGVYCKLVDGDDWVDPKPFLQYVQSLSRLDEDMIFSPYCQVYIKSGQVVVKRPTSIAYDQTYPVDTFLSLLGNAYDTHSLAFRTRLLKQIQPIDEHCFYVDQEYILYPLALVSSVHTLDTAVYQYRLGDAGQSMAIQNMYKNRAMHQRVIASLLAFMKEAPLSAPKRIFLEQRIRLLVMAHVHILLSAKGSGETKRELLAFLDWLQREHPEVYHKASTRKITLLKNFRGLLYRPMAWYYRWYLARRSKKTT